MMRALKPLAQLSSIVRMASTPNVNRLPSVMSGEGGAVDGEDDKESNAK
jgi:hypothetical protein